MVMITLQGMFAHLLFLRLVFVVASIPTHAFYTVVEYNIIFTLKLREKQRTKAYFFTSVFCLVVKWGGVVVKVKGKIHGILLFGVYYIFFCPGKGI